MDSDIFIHLEGTCGICGNLHEYVNCNVIQIKKKIPDRIIPSKARLTLPHKLRLEVMADGSLSIVTNECIEKGTQFGPLDALKLFTLPPSVAFPLKIFLTDGVLDFSEYYLDTTDEYMCNWMIFVEPATSSEEQNLICFQEKESIFYVATKDISAGEFLKVWYSPYYAQRMNKTVLSSKQNPENIKNYDNTLDLNKLLKKQQNIMDRENWTCKFCSKLETDVTKFAKHILDHYSKSMQRNCDICKQSFSSRKNLRKHLNIVHKETVLVIPETKKKCKMKSSTTDKAIPNKESVVGGPLLDNILNDSLDNSTMLLAETELNLTNNIDNQNMGLENDNLNLSEDNILNENVKQLIDFNFEIDECQEQYVCDICLKVFTKLSNLIVHMRKHTGKYTCQQCLTIFCRNENLKMHQCINNQQHDCTYCGKSFVARKYLVRHIRETHNSPNQCETCNRVYSKIHNCPLVPDEEKQKFTCPICSKNFYKELYLKRHMRLHNRKMNKTASDISSICDICAQQFKNKKSLNVHMKTHSEPSYNCDVCNKRFCKQAVFAAHQLTHTSKEVQCPICKKTFKSSKHMKNHMVIHTEKRHECSICHAKFYQRSNMVKHMTKVHNRSCELCKKQFNTDAELRQHKVSHFKDYYCCPLCFQKLKLKHSLIRHINHMHPNEKQSIDVENIKPVQFDLGTLIEQQKKKSNKKTEIESEVNDNNVTTAVSENCIDVGPTDEIHHSSDNNDSDMDSFSKDISTSISDSIDKIVDNFSKIITNYECNNPSEYIASNNPSGYIANNCSQNANLNLENSLGIGSSTFKEKEVMPVLDFNDLTMDYDTSFNLQPVSNEANKDVCLSMPDLTDTDLEITLGKNAYILENGTIVEPQEPGNYLVYVLQQQKFLDNIDIATNNQNQN